MTKGCFQSRYCHWIITCSSISGDIPLPAVLQQKEGVVDRGVNNLVWHV